MDSISRRMALAPWERPRLYRLSLTIATISSISVLLKDVSFIGYCMEEMKVPEGGDIVIHAPRRVRFLSLQFFDLEDHIRGDCAFLIEHGICEGLLGNGPYFSGDSEGEFVDCFNGAVIEEWF